MKTRNNFHFTKYNEHTNLSIGKNLEIIFYDIFNGDKESLNLNIVGLYKNNKYHIDENICYINDVAGKELVKQKYGKINSNDYFVKINKNINLNAVIFEFKNAGIEVTQFLKVNTTKLNKFYRNCKAALYVMLFYVLIIIIALKKKFEELRETMIFSFVVSCFISIILFYMLKTYVLIYLYFLYKMDLSIYIVDIVRYYIMILILCIGIKLEHQLEIRKQQ